MKRGTPEHPKTKLLASKLNVPLCTAVGVLELLWHFTARYAPKGDIGKFSDEEISIACYWHGSSEGVISGLIAAHWLDAHEEHRLVVHDWHDHADESVKKWLRNHQESFVTDESDDVSLETVDPDQSAYGYGYGSGLKNWGRGKNKIIEAVYQAYPRKIGKRVALEKIDLHIAKLAKQRFDGDGGAAAAWLKERVQTFAKSPKGQRRPPESDHCPHPATWFNQGRYDDDEAEWHRRSEPLPKGVLPDPGAKGRDKRAEQDQQEFLQRAKAEVDKVDPIMRESLWTFTLGRVRPMDRVRLAKCGQDSVDGIVEMYAHIGDWKRSLR